MRERPSQQMGRRLDRDCKYSAGRNEIRKNIQEIKQDSSPIYAFIKQNILNNIFYKNIRRAQQKCITISSP